MTLTVRTVNVAEVTAAVVAQLTDALTNVEVERAEELNETPGRCPWVGVYRDEVNFTTRTLGMASGYREARITLVAAVQESDGSSGAKCEDRLEALLADVLSAILSDTTLRGTVNTIEDVKVMYADYRRVGESFMQTAAIYLTAVAPVRVENT